jgi:SAM-dependent methyltransferase
VNAGQSTFTGVRPANTGSADDWEAHWTHFAGSNAQNPAQAYRRHLIHHALRLGSAPPPVRLLELGCGHGDFARDVLHTHPGIDFVGLDRAQTAVNLARESVTSGRFFQADLTDPKTLPKEVHGFATHAVCTEVLEHVDDPVAMLRGARVLFAPGCRVVITVPAGPRSAFDLHIGHRRHFTVESLSAMLEAAGLRPLSVEGAGFPFFNLYRLTVLARGKALIQDAEGDGRSLPASARAAMRAFSTLFRFNRDNGRFGWQLVAIAAEPGTP